jgi:hypothetical protein
LRGAGAGWRPVLDCPARHEAWRRVWRRYHRGHRPMSGDGSDLLFQRQRFTAGPSRDRACCKQRRCDYSCAHRRGDPNAVHGVFPRRHSLARSVDSAARESPGAARRSRKAVLQIEVMGGATPRHDSSKPLGSNVARPASGNVQRDRSALWLAEARRFVIPTLGGVCIALLIAGIWLYQLPEPSSAEALNLTRSALSGVDSPIAYARAWDDYCNALPVEVTITKNPRMELFHSCRV